MTHATDTKQNPESLAARHLQVHLRGIHRTLQAAVAAQKKIAAVLYRPDVTPLCVSDEQVAQLLQQVYCRLCYLPGKTSIWNLHDEERRIEEQLRKDAERRGMVLPMDAMVHQLGLTGFEKAAVLVCIAPELHSAYGRIFAYIQDDLRRQSPSIGMLCSLLAQNEIEWLQHRRKLSIHGRLRRLGVITTIGGDIPELHLACRPAPGVLERLSALGTDRDKTLSNWTDQFYDPDDVPPARLELTVFPERQQLQHAADALGHGQIDMLAIWGDPAAGVEAAVQAVAAHSGKPLRKLPMNRNAIPDALATASHLKAMLWIDVDRLLDDENRNLAEELLSHLLPGALPLVISGQYPWRPTALLARRHYYEVKLSQPDERLRIENWQHLISELPDEKAADLSQRFRLDPGALIAVKGAAEIQAKLSGNGTPAKRVDQLEKVGDLITQIRAGRFTKPVIPKRGPDDLVLPPELHLQVLEVAGFYKTLSLVNGHWGFGRLSTGAGGIKALFSGDSGTGKTLAAEVIAGQIGLPMLKIDLSQLVSKWVGETEKNIDTAFCEAEASHAMLFFDEADTLFGKRGEIQQGSDRYANLEVGYLLQRLEEFSGLAVLASNLKDEIDDGFTRRFQVILHFPRPREQERLRLWQMAFPSSAPLDDGVDLSRLVHLDMTGAGIFNACHKAALLAAKEGSNVIRHDHIVEGISRQFHCESRVIGPSDLSRFYQQNSFPAN